MGWLSNLEAKAKGGEPEALKKPHEPALLRDYAGILVCAIIVLASIAVGFVQVVIKVAFGADVTFDPSWMANLSAMASMALGALIQQKVNSAATTSTPGAITRWSTSTPPPMMPPEPLSPIVTPGDMPNLCPTCGAPWDENSPVRPQEDGAPVAPAPATRYPSGGRL